MKILVVDDIAVNRRLLRAVLEAEGLQVFEAVDGIEALAVLDREQIDAIISDILMPRMDGYRLCREVRANERHYGTPFIFYTATYTSPGDEKLSLELGADKYLKKPAPAAVLMESLREVTQARSHPAPQPPASEAELEVMKNYNERLVAKLEEKNIELLVHSAAVEAAANAIVITDPQGHIIFANPAFTTLTGYTREEVIGKTPRILKSGCHDKAFYQNLWKTILSNRTWSGEFTNRRKDGSLYYGEQTITPVCSTGGTLTHFIGIMNDVTARKQAEADLRTRQEHSQSLLQLARRLEGVFTYSEIFRAARETLERSLGFRVTWLYLVSPDGKRLNLVVSDEADPNHGRPKDGESLCIQGDRMLEEIVRSRELVVVEDARTDPRTNKALVEKLKNRTIVNMPITLWGKNLGCIGAGTFGDEGIRRLTVAERELFSTLASHLAVVIDRVSALAARIRAQEELRATHDQLQHFLAHSPAVLYTLRLDAEKVVPAVVSNNIERFLGISANEAADYQWWMNSLHPDDRDRVVRDTNAAFGGDGYSMEYRLRHQDGSYRWIEDNNRVVRNAEGRPIEAIGVWADITERKRAEAATHEAEARLKLAVHAGNIGIWDWDLQSNKVFYSLEWKSQIGYRDGEVTNDFSEWQNRVHPDDIQSALEKVRRYLAHPEGPLESEFRLKHKDGSYRWIYSHANLLRNSEGQPARILGSHLDITARKQAEKKLADEANFNRTLLEASPVGILTYRASGDLVSANEAAARLVGGTVEQLRRQNFRQINTWKQSGLLEAADRAIQTGKDQESEIRTVTSFGQSVWLSFRLIPFLYNGESHLMALFSDIADRKLSEEALHQRATHAALGAEIGMALTEQGSLRGTLQRCCEAAVKNLNAAFARIWTLNVDGTILELQASAGMYTHIDGPHGRVPVGQLKIGQIAQERKPHLTNSVIGDPRIPEQDWAKQEGLVAFAGYPLIVDDRLVGVMAMFARTPLSDATVDALAAVADSVALGIQRKQGEEALRESEERNRQLVEDAIDIIFTINPERVLKSLNPAFETITGFARTEWLEREFPPIVHTEDLALATRKFETVMAGKKPNSFQLRIKKAGTGYVNLEFTVTPQFHEQRVAMLLGIARDVTQRNLLELQLRESQKMEAIGQLAGGIAHDFNNILGAIMGYTDLVSMEVTDNSSVVEYLESIQQASNRAKDLVQQILAFSRRQEHQRQVTQLKYIVSEALKLLRASVPTTIQFVSHLKTTRTVLADPTAIHQVIMNLGTNAWHAMRDKPGVLSVELEDMEVDEAFAHAHQDLRPGNYVRLSIADTGSGMDRTTLDRIFEPFFTTKAQGEGTGLGLAVVHGVIKSHDGGISVYSQLGEGTKFDLFFPAFESEPEELKGQSAYPIPRGNGERILFVDDEEPLVVLGKKILEPLGYEVSTFTKVNAALEAFQANPESFDLVITDYAMPTMNGITLAKELLKIRPSIPIILTTGFSGTMTPEKVREIGFFDLLLKPNTARSLGEIVHRAINQTR